MRLLLIVQDARLRSLIRHHVTCEWPNADLVMRSTRAPGLLPQEFLAQGYDAVLIDQDWLGGEGLAWLKDLGSRRGFAPILFLAQQVDGAAAREARIFGAFGVLGKQRLVQRPYGGLRGVHADGHMTHQRVKRHSAQRGRMAPGAHVGLAEGRLEKYGHCHCSDCQSCSPQARIVIQKHDAKDGEQDLRTDLQKMQR